MVKQEYTKFSNPLLTCLWRDQRRHGFPVPHAKLSTMVPVLHQPDIPTSAPSRSRAALVGISHAASLTRHAEVAAATPRSTGPRAGGEARRLLSVETDGVGALGQRGERARVGLAVGVGGHDRAGPADAVHHGVAVAVGQVAQRLVA